MARRRFLLGRRKSGLDRLTVHEFQYGDARVRVYEEWTMRPELAESPDVPTFVLVHGLGVSSRFFLPLAHQLSPYGRVLLFDLPGFHDLPKPRHRMSIVDFADVVKRALDDLDVDDPLLVGHSMGAQVVAEVLAQYPSYSSASMLVGPVVVSAERTLPQVIRRFLQASIYEPPGNTITATAAYARAGLRWILDTVPKVISYPIDKRLPLAKARLLLASGEHDLISPPAWRELLASAVPGSRVVTIPGAAHGVVHDSYRELADELLDLAGVGTA
ncbi:alpha/beta fold hydrolase [Micropruina sp.]|uniref:alpha/beta fold hydrolase n=1 Tax=Micropruina sp. TaxID=2737536 RepID=UPI0026117C60|nr:alpha/beta fold hydrolase [Micropruina sp.]